MIFYTPDAFLSHKLWHQSTESNVHREDLFSSVVGYWQGWWEAWQPYPKVTES